MTTHVKEAAEVSTGWHIRQATAEDDWSGIAAREEGKLYWVRHHSDGRVTKVCASPGQTIRAAAEMDEGAEAAAGSDPVADTDRADTPQPSDPIEEIEEQPDDFPNPGAGFSRGLAVGATRAAGELFTLSPETPAVLAQQMHPDLITTHPSTLMRAGGLHAEHVDDLEAVLASGGTLPPVDVFFDGREHWLADGNHRHAAALRAGALLDVNVHRGTLRDAVLFAVRSNASHGLKRTNDDKRLAVVTLLADEEWGRQSDTSVASLADVTQPFVGKVQAWLVRLLPVLGGDGVEDPSDVPDEEFAARAVVPDGLVSAVRGLTDAQLVSLTNNVMSRAGSRTSKDGKQFSVERTSADEPPPLLADVEPAPDAPGDAQETADEAGSRKPALPHLPRPRRRRASRSPSTTGAASPTRCPRT